MFIAFSVDVHASMRVTASYLYLVMSICVSTVFLESNPILNIKSFAKLILFSADRFL